MKLMKRPVQSTRSTESCMSLQFWCAEDPCRSEGVCVCVWTSVTKRTQGFCNNLAHQLIEHAKISSMFYCILAGGPRAHHTARANEALYDEARKRTCRPVRGCWIGHTLCNIHVTTVAMYSCKQNKQESAWSPDWPRNPWKLIFQ